MAAPIIIEQQPIHWEAVLITAIPAVTAMIASIAAAWFGVKNHRTVKSIDRAVNGTMPNESTLRENVEKINQAVNGAAPGDDSIRENVQALVERRDLDPEVK